MNPSRETLLVTGASGQLGRLVLAELRQRAPTARLIGAVRKPQPPQDGIEYRIADYNDPASLAHALAGVDKLLLISSSEIGQRLPQHARVIEAARAAGVKLLAYTSLLHADRSPLALAAEHRETEALLRASGLPVAILRNGWYTENLTGNLDPVLQHGAVIGAARDGRLSLATRADYAAAAAAVLAADPASHAGRVHELAGDQAWTLADYAAEIARQTHQPVVYRDLGEAGYRAALQAAGLPEAFAALIADSDAGAAQGALFDDGGTLRQLIGRPTTPLAAAISTALAARRTDRAA